MIRFAPAERPRPPDAGVPAPGRDPSGAAAPLGSASRSATEPLPGCPAHTERPERKRGRRSGKALTGQGPETTRAFPQAGFPLWARINAKRSEGRTRRSADEGRIAASQHFEATEVEEPLDRSEGTSVRGFEKGNARDCLAEKRAQSGEGRGPDRWLEAYSTTDRTDLAPDALEAAFLAGASLAALDFVVRTEAPWLGSWSARLALRAAAASARLLGRGEDEAALRDAFALRRPGDDPGPAGRLLAAWRRAAGRRPDLVFERDLVEKIAFDLGLPRGGPVMDIVEDAASLAKSEKPSIFVAVETAAHTFRMLAQGHGREAEILAHLLADAVLACRLRWPVFVPLLAGVAFDSEFRRGPEGKRARPGDPDWPQACCLGFARAAASAHDLARDLARRSEKLEAAVPKLRAKDAEAAVARILEDDAVSASMRPGNLSERAARRMFDRLVSFGVLRELTGRPTFRLYGL